MENNLFELTREDMEMKADLIVGSDRIRNNLKKIICENFHKEVQEEYARFLDINRNVLLYGKPGTGKTSICYETMLTLDKACYYHLNVSTLISEKLGKTPKLIDDFFKKVIEKTKKYQVFLLVEEIEAFLPDRSNSKELEDMKRALTIFMHYLDKNIENLIVLCTTNHIDRLDAAIIRRFSFRYEIVNNDEKAIISFLTSEKNPFKNNFTSEEKNIQIARSLIKRNATFSELKHYMRELHISGLNVNDTELIKLMECDDYE